MTDPTDYTPPGASQNPTMPRAPESNRRRTPLVRLGIVAFAVLAAAWAVADYRAFEDREQRATEIVTQLGGQRVGGVGGWLIGRDSVVRFDRELSDDDLDQLAELGRLGGGHRFAIETPGWQPSQARRDEIRRKLGKHCYLIPEPATTPGR